MELEPGEAVILLLSSPYRVEAADGVRLTIAPRDDGHALTLDRGNLIGQHGVYRHPDTLAGFLLFDVDATVLDSVPAHGENVAFPLARVCLVIAHETVLGY